MLDGPPPEDDLEEVKYNTCLQAELNNVQKLGETHECRHCESLCCFYTETPEVCQRLEQGETNVQVNSKDNDLKKCIASNKNFSAGVTEKNDYLEKEDYASLLRRYLFFVCVGMTQF